MDRRHLEHFLAVAERGSFTGAAAALNIAQPSLSHSISTLERELGSRLFERLGRGVRLTTAGEALIQPAQRTLRSFELAAGAVRSVGEGGFGRLSLISNTLWALEPLVRATGVFRQLHPGVQFTVADPSTRFDVLEQVRSGAHDFGLVDGTPPAGALDAQWLVDHQFVAVLPPRALPGRHTVTVGDLVPLGLIGTPRGTPLREYLDDALQAAGHPPELAVQTAHVATVVPLVLSGAGATLLPADIAADAAARGARVVALDEPTVASVHLIWRAGSLTGLGEHFRALMATLAGDP